MPTFYSSCSGSSMVTGCFIYYDVNRTHFVSGGFYSDGTTCYQVTSSGGEIISVTTCPASVTPSVTPSITRTPSVTPTVTPSITPTPSIGPNFFIVHNGSVGEITDVSPVFYVIGVGVFPVASGFDAEGSQSGTSSQISVQMGGTVNQGMNVSLYVNSVLEECISFSSTGTYTFNAVTINSTDLVQIIVNDGSCI